jgi:transcriptional regulator with XRE-family HTH domain
VLRLRDGLTQAQLAEYTGIPIATYQRTERGERIPTIPELSNCAITLGVPLEDLIEDEWREWVVLAESAGGPPNHWRPWHQLGQVPESHLEKLPPAIRAHLRKEGQA